MNRIAAAQVYRADLPLSVRLEHASASEAVLEEVFLRLVTTSGEWGLAEVRGNGAYATGADTKTVIDALISGIGRAMIGVELVEVSAHVAELSEVPLARALVDMAALDARARQAGKPLWQILGGRQADAIPTHAQIGFCTLDQALERARAAAGQGFRRIKVRVGRPQPKDDIAIVRAVRDEVPDGTAIVLDANGAWDADTATCALSACEASRIAWAEQPTPAGDDDALRRVRRATNIPVIADEAIRTTDDLIRLCEADAIDGVHLKLEKAGSASGLITLAAQARRAGLLICLGQMDQGRLGSSITVHLAATIEADAYELWGFQHITRDVTEGLDMRDGDVVLPPGAGTGVDVNLNELILVGEIT